MNFLIQELEALLTTPQSRVRSVILAGIGAAITAVVTWLHLSRFATADEIFTWSTALTGLICTGVVHAIDHYVGNAHVLTALKQAPGTVVSSAPLSPGASIPDNHSIVPNSLIDALLNGAPQSQQAGAVTPPAQPEVSPETSSAKP